MKDKTYVIEPYKLFSKSLLWQLNRNFYQEKGLDAWRNDGSVPFHLTSNAMVGKTYAELIFAYLKDVSIEYTPEQTLYILELGAGHGRLAFHILKHLDRLTEQSALKLPSYCYVLSDISEDNLTFYSQHSQFNSYFDKGVLDIAYFDAVESKELHLRLSDKRFSLGEIDLPLIAIANYFFDSIPTDLFHIKNTQVSSCSVALESNLDPKEQNEVDLIENLDLAFQSTPIKGNFYSETILNEILEEYKHLVFDTYLFFPHKGVLCMDVLRQFSPKGLMLLTMDKGYHQIHNLENINFPEIIKHGSFSVWVNYHALQSYCQKMAGFSLFPSASTFYSQLGCFFISPMETKFPETTAAYQKFVDDFGPDDFNGIKRMAYKNVASLNLPEILSLLRLSCHDNGLFTNFLPRIKQVAQRITFKEREGLKKAMDRTWNMYFFLEEKQDLAYEIGGILYDLGFYQDSLQYFQCSIEQYGIKPDILYNKILCLYQLREDKLFVATLQKGKKMFPAFEEFAHLDQLDLNA